MRVMSCLGSWMLVLSLLLLPDLLFMDHHYHSDCLCVLVIIISNALSTLSDYGWERTDLSTVEDGLCVQLHILIVALLILAETRESLILSQLIQPYFADLCNKGRQLWPFCR